MASTVLSRDVFLQIRDELSGKHDEYIEVIPGVKARVIQLTCEAGFALVAMAQKDDETNKDKDDSVKNLGVNSFRWICACVVDADGNPVFKMDDFKDLPFELVQRLARAVNRVNGLSAPEGIDEAEKN